MGMATEHTALTVREQPAAQPQRRMTWRQLSNLDLDVMRLRIHAMAIVAVVAIAFGAPRHVMRLHRPRASLDEATSQDRWDHEEHQ